MGESELQRRIDAVLSGAVDAPARESIRHALGMGFSPLSILRGIFMARHGQDMAWMCVEAVMAEWCRLELKRITAAGAYASAEHARIWRWKKELEEVCDAPLPNLTGLDAMGRPLNREGE